MSLENRGVPTVVICTAPFIDSALIQSRAFGQPDFQPVSISHPLGGLDSAGIRERALAAEEQVIAALIKPG